MKLDKRKKYFMVIDTEGKSKPYEIGVAVADKCGNIYYKKDFILNQNKDEFYNFKSDFIYKKLYFINETLKAGNAKVVFEDTEIKNILNKILQYFNIQEIYCFNVLHDKELLKDFVNNNNLSWYDIWGIACQVLGTQKTFQMQAEKTSKGNYKTNVETFYKYITQKEYRQTHNALIDAIQELEILIRCFRNHKKINKNYNKNCWKIPNQVII